jgi:WS/DGAT/MGAT family acyltransferase
MLWKLHHVVADGERALALLGALVDPDPSLTRDDWRPAPRPGSLALVVDASRRLVVSLAAALSMLAHPRRIVERIRAGSSRVRTDLRRDAPRLPFNRPLGQRRRYLLVRADLDAVRMLAHRHRATVNDIVIAAFAAGVTDLLRELGRRTAGLMLQVSVPVSLRHEGPQTGNAVGGLKIGVPLDSDPGRPAALLDAVAAATRARKAGPPADAGFGGLGSELMPVPLLRAVLGRALRGDQRFINTYVTDLIGPPSRVALAGVEIAEGFPIGPLSAGVGLGAAALSYAGQLSITVLADPDACRRVDLVAAGIERFLHALAMEGEDADVLTQASSS